MKEQNYKRLIKGISLDKLQEGDFCYEPVLDSRTTLSQFAKQVRAETNKLTQSSLKRCQTR